MNPHLVFVYNADSGLFNTLSDSVHKLISPETYNCNLCALTYGAFGMRDEWRAFLETLDASPEFLHRDELATVYGITGAPLPAVFRKAGESLQLLAGADAINACSTMSQLKELIGTHLHDI